MSSSTSVFILIAQYSSYLGASPGISKPFPYAAMWIMENYNSAFGKILFVQARKKSTDFDWHDAAWSA